MQTQDTNKNDVDLFIIDEDFKEASRSPLYRLKIYRFLSTETTFVEVYSSRITIIKKPVIAVWEHKETYHIMDMGDIIVNKGLFRSTLEVRRRNSPEHLFILANLTHVQAARLKEILNMMIVKRQKFMFNPVNTRPQIFPEIFDP
jgi:hypothetical protein